MYFKKIPHNVSPRNYCWYVMSCLIVVCLLIDSLKTAYLEPSKKFHQCPPSLCISGFSKISRQRDGALCILFILHINIILTCPQKDWSKHFLQLFHVALSIYEDFFLIHFQFSVERGGQHGIFFIYRFQLFFYVESI